MAKDLSLVVLTGRLGADPDVRYTTSGTAVATFRMAVNRSIKENGEWKTVADWFKVKVWGKDAEFCAEHLAKGSKVLIHGRLELETWQSDTGPVTAPLITANNFGVTPLESKKATKKQENLPYGEEDDLPF